MKRQIVSLRKARPTKYKSKKRDAGGKWIYDYGDKKPEKARTGVVVGRRPSGKKIIQSGQVHGVISSKKGEHGIGHPMEDTPESRELSLHTDNNEHTYNRKQAFKENIAKKIRNLAHVMITIVTDKDHDIHAHQMLHEIHDEVKDGEHDHLKTKKTLAAEKKAAKGKKAKKSIVGLYDFAKKHSLDR